MSIDIKVIEAPTTMFEKDVMGLEFSVAMTFKVKGEEAIKVMLNGMDVKVQPKLEWPMLRMQIKEIKDYDVTASDSKIGAFNSEEFKNFLNVSLRFALPFINSLLLSRALPLPNTFLNLLSIKTATLTVMEGYMVVSLEPEFLT